MEGIVAIFFVIGVPVMALAGRFVLRPLIGDLTEAVRSVKGQSQQDLEPRLARLEAVLVKQSQQIERLAEAEQFQCRLEAPSDRVRVDFPSVRPASLNKA